MPPVARGSRAIRMFSNPTPLRSEQAPTVNACGTPAWERPISEMYIQSLLTNTFGQTLYKTAQELHEQADCIHSDMLSQDSEFAGKALVFARQYGYMRTQPIYGLAKLSAVNPDAFERAFPAVIRTPKDLREFTVMLKSLRGGEGGRVVKRAAAEWLIGWLGSEGAEYWTIKYGSDDSAGYSLRDLLCVYHPNFGRQIPLVDWIFGRKADVSSLPKITAFERLKHATTDDEKAKAIIDGRLPHEVATSFAGHSKKVWSAIVPNLPIFALLKNLATLERHEVLTGENRDIVVAKLTNPSTVASSMIFPFRFVEAMEHVTDAKVRDALRDAAELSFVSIPEIPGKTAVLLDRSGSMLRNNMIRTAAMFGMAAVRKAADGRLIAFNMQQEEIPVSTRDSLLTQAGSIVPSGDTDTGAAFSYLLDRNIRVDSIVCVTDEEQNRGTPFVDVLEQYRDRVNRGVKVFVINVSPNAEAMVPAYDRRGRDDKNVHYCYGWSDQALRYISLASRGWASYVDVVRTMSFADAKVASKPTCAEVEAEGV